MKKEILFGLIGGVSLILFYFLLMSVSSGDWRATISQFKELWYWMILLAGGFAVQIGLFAHLKMKSSKAVVVTSTGTSAASIIACCAHHLSDVLAITGLSGAAVLISSYQTQLIILGILMNIFGIIYMLKQIKKLNKHLAL